MSKISYTVICTIQSDIKAQEWLYWLKSTHINDVITAGANCAEIVKLDQDSNNDTGTTYEIRYQFNSRRIFEKYINSHAQRLREDGLKHFPPEDGFEYKRNVGEFSDI